MSLPECKLCRCYQGLCHDDMEEIKDDDNVKEMNDTNVTFKNHDHVNVENKMLLMTMMKMMEQTISKINNIEDKLVGTKIPFFFIILCLLLGNAYREYESREKHLRNYIFQLKYFIL